MPRPDFETIRRKKRFGRCRICEKFKQLTKEHVPPAKAFNNQPYLHHYADETEKARRMNWQFREENTNGIYFFTLCDKCNNQTGRRYGSDYVSFVESFIPVATPENANSVIEVEIKDFFPLRVIKQAISMILSTSQPTTFRNHQYNSSPRYNRSSLKGIEIVFPEKSHQVKIYKELREFVRTRDLTGLPSGIRLYAYGNVNRTGFMTGIFTSISLNSKKVSTVAITGMHPIIWVLVLDGEVDKTLLEVTNWANFKYKQKKTLKVEMPFYWLAGKYPLDFRTPKELYEQGFVNRMLFEGLKFSGSNLSKEQELEEAIYFARILGKTTSEGYLISKFESGVFYEFDKINGWLEKASVEEAKEFIMWRLQQGE